MSRKADLSLVSHEGQSFTVSSYSFDPATHIAKWTFANPFSIDQIELDLPDTVTDLASNKLNGDWVNPLHLADTGTHAWPSGDSTAGGSFAFYFTIMPGDATATGSDPPDNIVGLQDLLNVKNNFGLTPATWIQGDTDGSNVVDLQDLLNVKNYFGTRFHALARQRRQ